MTNKSNSWLQQEVERLNEELRNSLNIRIQLLEEIAELKEKIVSSDKEVDILKSKLSNLDYHYR